MELRFCRVSRSNAALRSCGELRSSVPIGTINLILSLTIDSGKTSSKNLVSRSAKRLMSSMNSIVLVCSRSSFRSLTLPLKKASSLNIIS